MNELNLEWLGSSFSLYRISAPNLEGEPLTSSDRIRVWTRKAVQPAFYVELNFRARRSDPALNIVEINPNEIPRGWAGLLELLDCLFVGFDPVLFRVSRVDLNADIQLPVERLFRSLYVPVKRKSENYLLSGDHRVRTQFKRGLTGFYVGTSPAMLRVYDKREEMKAQGKDPSALPDPLTRVELELRHNKSPIRLLGEMPQLLNVEPFGDLRFLRILTDGGPSLRDGRRKNLEDLVARLGMHQAIRSLNANRHFQRDYSHLLEPVPEINEQLQRAFLEGVRQFLGMD